MQSREILFPLSGVNQGILILPNYPHPHNVLFIKAATGQGLAQGPQRQEGSLAAHHPSARELEEFTERRGARAPCLPSINIIKMDRIMLANHPVLPSQEHPTWYFPGGPVVKTPSSQCRGPRLDLWSGN